MVSGEGAGDWQVVQEQTEIRATQTKTVPTR